MLEGSDHESGPTVGSFGSPVPIPLMLISKAGNPEGGSRIPAPGHVAPLGRQVQGRLPAGGHLLTKNEFHSLATIPVVPSKNQTFNKKPSEIFSFSANFRVSRTSPNFLLFFKSVKKIEATHRSLSSVAVRWGTSKRVSGRGPYSG